MHYRDDDGSKWYLSSNNDLYQDVFAYIRHMDKTQSYRTNDNLRHARLYGNYQVEGLDAYSYAKSEASVKMSHRVTMNVIQSLVDTVVSKITKNKPKPTFLTSNGDWTLQQKAKKLTKFVQGVFTGTDFYDKAALAFQDACIFGTGAIKIYEQDGNIKCERTFIEELKTDDIESFYGEPRQIHQTKFIHKDVLIDMFPSKAVEIEKADTQDDQYPQSNVSQKTRSMIRCIESWHLPSGLEAKDGKHTITISTATLLSEEYKKDYFPFVFFRWGQRPAGFFGQGLAEQLQGLQLEINKILRTIQVSMHLISVPKLLVEASSKIVNAHLNNKIGGIIRYAGTPPSYAQLGSIPPDLFSHLDRLYNRAYEISGVSQLSAQSLKPSGLDSGKALREYNDLETERFLATAKRYEKSFMDASKIIIDIARDLYGKDENYAVNTKGRKFIEEIKWKDVNIEDNQYMMDVFPTSALSNTPAGRLQDVQDLISAGFIDQTEGMKLLDFPDLEGSINMINADVNNLEKLIEKMIDEGEYFPPEPYQNLENAVRKMQQAYIYHRMNNAPEDRLELLRRYMEDAQGLIQKASQPSQAELSMQLAEQGAAQASAIAAENANLGAQPLNPIIEGAIDLGEGEELPLEEELPPVIE